MNFEKELLFHPLTSAYSSTFWISLLLAILALAYLLWSFKNKASKTRYTSIFQLLAGFLFLLSIGSAFMTWLTRDKIGPVQIGAEQIEFADKQIKYNEIANAYIHTEKNTSAFNSTLILDTSFFLIIEEIKGRNHIFSREEYDILNMVKEIRDRME